MLKSDYKGGLKIRKAVRKKLFRSGELLTAEHERPNRTATRGHRTPSKTVRAKGWTGAVSPKDDIKGGIHLTEKGG